MASPFLTSQQVAEALGYHRSTVHRWDASGALRPALKVTHGAQEAWYYDPETVAEFARVRRMPLAVVAGSSSQT